MIRKDLGVRSKKVKHITTFCRCGGCLMYAQKCYENILFQAHLLYVTIFGLTMRGVIHERRLPLLSTVHDSTVKQV